MENLSGMGWTLENDEVEMVFAGSGGWGGSYWAEILPIRKGTKIGNKVYLGPWSSKEIPKCTCMATFECISSGQ